MSRFSQSRLAAGLQEIVSRRREEVGLYAEVVALLQLPATGRLLEAGCGSGLQLKAIHANWPGLKLYGLDLSGAAIRNARRNLAGMAIDLREGSIENTTYADGFFDVATCFASMSYWSNLVGCFNEIYRILKPGGTAQLVEPYEDIDYDQVVNTIKAQLRNKSRLRRFMAVNVNKFGLRYGRKLGLRLYSIKEIEEVALKSRFGGAHEIERTTIQNLPIFLYILLQKPAKK